MVATAAEDKSATYPSGARPGREGTERVEPEPKPEPKPEPERGGRPLSPNACRSFAAAPHRPPAPREGAPAAPPSSARPPTPSFLSPPSRLPGSSVEAWGR